MIHVVVCDLGYVLDDLLFEVENLTVFSHVKSHCGIVRHGGRVNVCV